MKKTNCIKYRMFWFVIGIMLISSQGSLAQTTQYKEDYRMTEDQKLEIIVHVWGEIKDPGQYSVPDGTDVLELISLAGGPNEYSSLSNVILSRELKNNDLSPSEKTLLKKRKHIKMGQGKMIIRINLQRHLQETGYEPMYILKPGDVVTVKRNNWFKFQAVLRIITQLSIVAQAFYYFTRIEI